MSIHQKEKNMTETLTLPSGKTATIKNGIGRDLLNAQRKAKSPEEIMFALMAELVEVDGQSYVYEDFLEMPLQDVLALQTEISGKSQSASQAASSTSPTPPDGATAS
jgi:hypothetical protein